VSNDKQDSRVQGEGDYRSARRYRRDVQEFVAGHHEEDIEELARDAAPRSEAEQRDMLEAEREGRARARGRKPGNSPSER
jgi:hypothetical protein